MCMVTPFVEPVVGICSAAAAADADDGEVAEVRCDPEQPLEFLPHVVELVCGEGGTAWQRSQSEYS